MVAVPPLVHARRRAARVARILANPFHQRPLGRVPELRNDLPDGHALSFVEVGHALPDVVAQDEFDHEVVGFAVFGVRQADLGHYRVCSPVLFQLVRSAGFA